MDWGTKHQETFEKVKGGVHGGVECAGTNVDSKSKHTVIKVCSKKSSAWKGNKPVDDEGS